MTIKTNKKKLKSIPEKKGQDKRHLVTCEECGKEVKIRNSNSWNHHLRMHSAEKFKCDCMAGSASWQAKERHMRIVHEGWIVCKTCQQPIESNNALEEHMKMHENKVFKDKKDEKRRGTKYPQICPECGESFHNSTRREQTRFT